MTVLFSIPSISRPAGTYNIPAQALGQTVNTLQIAISRAGLPVGPVADISMERSEDGGATWRFLGGATLSGGVSLKKDGTTATESTYSLRFEDAQGAVIPMAATDRVRAKVVLFQTATASVEIRAV